MDNMGCVQVRPPAPRKEKKKQPKDELDRNKQAEKKRRRLEKALATSAAIISELEKKKQKKKEELQRLDEEGAAIAEAVALQVLCDDQGDSCQIVLKKSDRFELDPWDHARNIGVLMGGWKAGTTYQSFAKHPVERVGWVSDAYGSECKWNGCEFGWSFTTGNEILRRDAVAPHFVERGQGAELSAGLMAAQAVSALQIADVHEDAFAGERRAAIVINGMMESGDLALSRGCYRNLVGGHILTMKKNSDMEQWRARRKGLCNRTTGVSAALYGLYFLAHIENFQRLQVLQKLSSLF